MKVSTDIQRMNLDDFGDPHLPHCAQIIRPSPLSFHLAPSSGQH